MSSSKLELSHLKLDDFFLCDVHGECVSKHFSGLAAKDFQLARISRDGNGLDSGWGNAILDLIPKSLTCLP